MSTSEKHEWWRTFFGSVVAAGLVAWGVTSFQLNAAKETAREERLTKHIAALEGFEQSVRIFGDILDDHSGRGGGPEGTGQESQLIADGLDAVHTYALEVRTTANTGDFDGTGALKTCDDRLRDVAEAFLGIPAVAPLSWDDVNGPFVDREEAPGKFAHVDVQIDQILPATDAVIEGVKVYVRDGTAPASISCDDIYPRLAN